MSKHTKRNNPIFPSEVIAKRRTAISLRRGYSSLIWRMVLIFAVCWLMFTQVFLLMQAQGNGMFPAVKDGDLVIAFRLQKDYVKDSVVVYTVNNQRRIGRIVALATDVITLDDTGTLLVNGTVQSGEILYPSYAKAQLTYPYTVPEHHVFIMGDHRTQTEDSRDHGPIPMENVQAKVITILRRQGI